MQSLNLSGTEKKSDGPIKSLLWPTVDSAWDVDYLGQQGFWICLVIAILSFGITALTAFDSPLISIRAVTLTVAGIESLVYFIGGMGVRQASPAAAIIVFTLYAIEHFATGQIGVLTIIIAAVLLSNVRATILASRWKPASEDEDRPSRFNETFKDKIVDQLPPRAWPILRYPFYILAAILLTLVVAGSVQAILHKPPRIPNENATPSVVVTPSDAN